MKSISVCLSIAIFHLWTSACSDKIDPMDDMEEIEEAKVTYTESIKPILNSKCVSCHSAALTGPSRNGAPDTVNLDSYGAAKSLGASAYARIEANSMPPDTPLSDEEKQLFKQWVDEGLPE